MLSIGDFARLGHVSPRMLRHYDELGPASRAGRPDDRVPLVPGGPARPSAPTARAEGSRLEPRPDRRPARRGSTTRGAPRHVAHPPRADRAGSRRRRGAPAAGRSPSPSDRREQSNERIHDIVLKKTDPLRIAEAVGVAPGFGPENLSPLFGRLLPEVYAHIDAAGAKPGMHVGWYEQPDDEGSVVLHAGVDIGDQSVDDAARLHVVDLPVVEAKCCRSCTRDRWRRSRTPMWPSWRGSRTEWLPACGAGAVALPRVARPRRRQQRHRAPDAERSAERRS